MKSLAWIAAENAAIDKRVAAKRRAAPVNARNPRDRRLRCRVSGGVLTIEIGVDVLAHAALYLDFRADGGVLEAPEATIKNTRAFAVEVAHELEDEEEDGSTLVTRMLDKAIENAIDNGSEHFEPTNEGK